MKSTIMTKENNCVFPCLMIYNDMVLLMTKNKKGVVIIPGSTTWQIGQYRDDWDMDLFTVFNGTVTLEN